MQTIIAPARLALLAGAGGTWPATLPRQMRIPIDHIAAGAGLAFLKREVLPQAGSDHAPVLASIGVLDTANCVAG
jgi:endonuclease/exonuclease/phosphatase (EEP) superfamily protein YafD